jgi:glyoxylase-like metal-dependent hydrolase (beta-lactamase superfamily II)
MAEILKGVHYVDGSNANSYLVEEADGTLTLVDATMRTDGKTVLEYVSTRLMRKPSEVKTIILTHCHVDHVRGAAALRTVTGGRVAIHEKDAGYLSGEMKYPTPRGAGGFFFRTVSPLMRTTPVKPDQMLKEGDQIGRFTVLHTPGHTPGSIALYDKGSKVLFVGDTVRFRKGKLEGPPRQFTLDMAQVKASIDRLSALDFEVVLSGHGEPLSSKNAPQMMKELSISM